MTEPNGTILDAAGFHEQLVGLLPVLRQQALALTRNRADADDLVQAAVTNALAARASFEAGTNFRAWMIRILRNRFFSNMRGRRDTVDIDAAPAPQLARSGGQEEMLEMQELRRCLARLPADQRLVLLMISVQGLSYEEASAQLGVAVGTLKCRVFRARALLRGWMLGEERSVGSIAGRAEGVAITATGRATRAAAAKRASAVAARRASVTAGAAFPSLA